MIQRPSTRNCCRKEAEAKAEAEKNRPGLTMFTDGSRPGDEAAGHSVVWQNGQTWVGIKTHMGYNEETYGEERATLATALETASRRQTTPERVTIFTGAQGRCRQAEGLGGAWPRLDLRAPGKKANCGAAEGPAGHHHRGPVVPTAQLGPMKREGRRVGQACGEGARRLWGEMVRIVGPGGGAWCCSPDSSRTSSGRTWRRSGRLGGGLVAGPPGRNTGRRAGRSRTVRLPIAPRGSPRGFSS